MAKAKSMWPVIGAWAFVAGLVLALIAGLVMKDNQSVPLVLGLLGIVVGLVNVTDSETTTFLVAAIAFMVAASSLANVAAFVDPGISKYLVSVFTFAGVFVAPAAAVVAIKALYGTASSA